MGNYQTTSHDSAPTTAKLVLEDGNLREFSYPVKVSKIVNRSNNFICKADDLDYDVYISAINGEVELQLGQLYFLLPLTWLQRPLRAPAMAALAVKASLALKSRTLNEIMPVVAVPDCSGGRGLQVKRKGRKSKFGRNLSIIVE